ncbi:MAG TPA: phytoene desaturase family protein [Gemmatimonadales bacterium]|nr:phytoene desaturase family protein [Gemmatimonadales bacterium]
MSASLRASRPPAPAAGMAGADRPVGRQVLVIGAGLGGLAAAIRLRHQGYEVTILERHAVPGGRCGLWESEGFRFDTGPTLLLMIEYLQALFRDVGRPLEAYLDLVQLDPNYRVHYADGRTLDVTSRLNAMLREVERVEPGSGPRLLRFLAATSQLYRVGLDGFVDRNVHHRRDFLSLRNAALLVRGGAMRRLDRMVARFFASDELRNTFSFQSLYLGLSPFAAPAIYGLLPYAEIAGGLYFPLGGMHALPRALARLATELGVRIRYGTDVAALERAQDRISAVRLADGTRLPADLVLANADLPYVYQTLLGEPHPRAARFGYSCSAFLMYLGVRGRYPDLPHHTLVVPADLRSACADIFSRHRIPDLPPYYICNPNKSDPSLAPVGCENLYVLVPVPSRAQGEEIDWAAEGPRLEQAMLARLERFGLPGLRDRVITSRTFTPADFATWFSATRGEAFGLAHGLDQVGYLRPHNRHQAYRNLYFVGQSTHPGCGVPMVLISARLTAERMVGEQGIPR